MKKGKLIKERVCIAFFAIGLTLAAFHQIGCNSQSTSYAAHIQQISLLASPL